MMIPFRMITYSIPQILIFLMVGARFDLLFGFNHTDAGFSLLIKLFIISPILAVALMITELIIYIRHRRREESRPSFRMAGLSMFLMIEALAVDLYILSQARM